MAEDGGTVGNTELAGLLAGDFDTATAVRALAAAVMRLAKQIDELAAEVVRLGVSVAQLERARPAGRTPKEGAKDG